MQTNHIRQPLNNHTKPFYLPEFLSKVQNIVSSLSGGNDLGARHVVCTDNVCYTGCAAKDSTSKQQRKSQGVLVSGRFLGDARNTDLK